MGVIWIVGDLLNILTLGWFARQVTEEEIVRNIRYLKEEKNSWFQELLANETSQKLIIHDWDVRTMIGQFEPQKMKRSFYMMRQQKRIDTLLLRKSKVLVP